MVADPDDPQAEVRAFLARLAGAGPQETQTSAVFVGGDTAWKLKRAVRLTFLDYTTVEARRHFTQRELAVNAQAAPGLYRDAVPITRGAGGLALGGDGEVVDWVLRMAPIPPGDFMLARIHGDMPDTLLDALGDMVAADHAARPPVPGHDPTHPRRNARGNAAAALARGLPPARVAAWLAAAEQALDAAMPMLAARAASGFVRRAHGDLHLGNICVWNGAPTPFDAIEFDEAMATIDLGYDLAFLLMDLHRRAGRAAANRVLNRYVARTGDAALVRLLPAFLSRRAMVRAHVEGDAGYLAAALDYLRPAPGCVVAIGGLPGTGKSTLARALAPGLGAAPGALIVRSDEIRKRLHGAAPEQPLGRDAYTGEANGRVDDGAPRCGAGGGASRRDRGRHVPVPGAAGGRGRVRRTVHRPLARGADGRTGTPGGGAHGGRIGRHGGRAAQVGRGGHRADGLEAHGGGCGCHGPVPRIARRECLVTWPLTRVPCFRPFSQGDRLKVGIRRSGVIRPCGLTMHRHARP